jgi:hypothetical protein
MFWRAPHCRPRPANFEMIERVPARSRRSPRPRLIHRHVIDPLRASRCREHASMAFSIKGSRGMHVNAEGEDIESERAEVHFLAALLDELMRKVLAAGVLTQAELNEVEAAAAKRVGGVPRAW